MADRRLLLPDRRHHMDRLRQDRLRLMVASKHRILHYNLGMVLRRLLGTGLRHLLAMDRLLLDQAMVRLHLQVRCGHMADTLHKAGFQLNLGRTRSTATVRKITPGGIAYWVVLVHLAHMRV